uniref:Uncharacterized protein n=1 Tax=Setaria digitata TaxID=48799 RepID=A0A915PW31_9BILA
MHVRFLMSNMNDERICLQIHFIPAVKVFYHILDGNSSRLVNAASLFQKCMNNKVNMTLFIESHSMQIWKQRFAGFRYEILPEWLITDKKSCSTCSSIDIINAFCNYADFVPIFGCLPQKGKAQRVYIAKMDFDMARIICSPLVSEYIRIAHENSQNTPCQLL